MAFPTIVGQATWTDAGTATTAQKATMPAGVQSGDLIMVWWVCNAGGVGTLDAKWTNLVNNINTDGARICYAIADGTESSQTLALTTLGSAQHGIAVARVYRNYGALPVASAVSAATGTAPNPNNCAPGLGAQDFEWLTSVHHNASGTFTSVPTNYASAASPAPQTGCGLNVANRTLNAASEDTGAWTYTSTIYSTWTVGIPGSLPITGTAESYSFSEVSEIDLSTSDDLWTFTDTSIQIDLSTTDVATVDDELTDREFVTFNDPWVFTDQVTDRELAFTDAFGGTDAFVGFEVDTGDTFTFSESSFEITVGWRTGHVHVGKFDPGDPKYTIQNEIISYEQISESQSRFNVVSIDGNLDSWTEYDRDDLVVRDTGVNEYFDMPELKSSGAVRNRAIEELRAARRVNSPGGQCVWQPWFTIKDPHFWVDDDNQKYTATIEGLSVEFDQSEKPFQRVGIDTGNVIVCDDDTSNTYLFRDPFDRDTPDGLGTANTGGDWVIY